MAGEKLDKDIKEIAVAVIEASGKGYEEWLNEQHKNVIFTNEKAKELGYKSRNEFLKTYLERQFLYLDKLVEYEGKYEILLDKVLKVLDYNTLALNKFCEENLIDVEEIVKEDRFKEEK